jgi:hypothetical protein
LVVKYCHYKKEYRSESNSSDHDKSVHYWIEALEWTWANPNALFIIRAYIILTYIIHPAITTMALYNMIKEATDYKSINY